MPDIKKLDPTGERAAATEAMETTPISGKEHEYRADGDHHPRPDPAAAPEAEVQAERHISQGIPGAGETPGSDAVLDAGKHPTSKRA